MNEKSFEYEVGLKSVSGRKWSMNTGSLQGKCRTQDPFQMWWGQWMVKELWRVEARVIKQNGQEHPSHRGRSESIRGTSPTPWKDILPNAFPAGCQLCYGPVIPLAAFLPFSESEITTVLTTLKWEEEDWPFCFPHRLLSQRNHITSEA